VRAARVRVEVVPVDEDGVSQQPIIVEMKDCRVDLAMDYGTSAMYGLWGQVIGYFHTGKNKLTLKVEN
jgi:hypothetical protein